MPDSIAVGSAEFQMLMNLPAFREAVAQQAPAVAKEGAQKVAKELEAGAKAGADAQIREAKRATAAIVQEQNKQSQGATRGARGSTGAPFDIGARSSPGQGDTRSAKAALQAIKEVDDAEEKVRRKRGSEGFLGLNSTKIAAAAAAIAGVVIAINQYAEGVKKTVELQDELNRLYGEGTVQLKSYTELAASIDALGESFGELSSNLGVLFAPALKATVDLLNLGTKAAIEFLTAMKLLTPEQTQEVKVLEELRKANSDAAKAEKERAVDAAKASADSAKERSSKEIEKLDAIGKASADAANKEKQRIGDVLDTKLRALDDGERAALRAIDEESKAAERAFRDAIERAEEERDAQKEAAESRRDNALRIMEAEADIRERARDQEDRDRNRQDTAEQRSLERRQTGAQRALDAERTAIDRKRDAALAAIDDERDAEDRRHSEVIDNLRAEEDERLGAIDDQLKALSRQEQLERRIERGQDLTRDIKEAKGDLSAARRSGDPREIKRAQDALNRAEREAQRESRQNQRDSLRDSLEDQKDAIREEIKARVDAETQKNEAVTQGLDDRQKIIEAAKVKDAEDFERRKIALADQQALEKQALADAQLARDEAVILQRQKEDEAIKMAKEAITDRYKFELDKIKETFDDPGGIIPNLKKQEEAVRDSYDRQKQRVDDTYRDAKRAATDAANHQLRALEIQTDNVRVMLDRQKAYWTEYANHAARVLAVTQAQAKAPSLPAGSTTQQTGVGPLYQGTGMLGTSAQSPAPPPSPGPTLQQFLNSLPGHASGGMISEPTLLYGQRSRRFYGKAGEAGVEHIVPAGGMGGGMSISMPITVNGASITSDSKLADMIAQKAATQFAVVLDKVQRHTRQRASSTLPGAN